jgi:hypothetical protein
MIEVSEPRFFKAAFYRGPMDSGGERAKIAPSCLCSLSAFE